MVSIRLLQKIGTRYAQDYITKFGFSRKDHPAYLTMALGAGATTPWGMASGYAVFANGGYRVKPHLISKITNSKGQIIEQVSYPRAHQDAPRVIDGRNAFLMTSMMRDVVLRGTATKAKSLGRQDLAGKTGTTNNQIDAWFAGYNPKQVAVAWIGYDQPKSLGKDETGGKAALPIWIRYMATALRGTPDVPYNVPEGVMIVKIHSETGTLAYEDEEGIYEYFYHETPPPSVETFLPPMEDASESDFPDSMLDNPLQAQPPQGQDESFNDNAVRPNRDAVREPNRDSSVVTNKPKPANSNAAAGTDAAARIMNPAGN